LPAVLSILKVLEYMCYYLTAIRFFIYAIIQVTYAKCQPNVSFLENIICVLNENADVLGRNVFVRVSVMTENALKLANSMTENQAHCFMNFLFVLYIYTQLWL
jgi:hypothetical protein